MFYCGKFTFFLGSNAVIIGKKESGKTTILRNVVNHCYEKGYTILLFDSKTSTIEKSLLFDANNKCKDNIIIPSPSKEDIKFSDINYNCFPFSIVEKNDHKIYSFDVSKYSGEESNNLYCKQLVIQELTVMLPIVSKKKCIVIMDEVGFTDEIRDIINKYNSFDIQFVIAEHYSKNIPNSIFDVQLIL